VSTIAEDVAHFTSALDYRDLPTEVVVSTKLHVLDALGCGLAAHALGLGGAGRATMAGAGHGGASVLGLPSLLPAADAAFANAMLWHALDYDDTHSDSITHITVVVAPAAVAVAEELGRPGTELISAIVAGTETVARLGMAAAGRFHAGGFHATSVCGVFGAAVAGARLSRLDAGATTSALGIAGSMSSGILAFLDDGTETKPVHAAWAAHGGTLAARLASHGAQGPASVIEGRFGLYDAFVRDRTAPIAEHVADLGQRWETLNIAYKAYPACHYMHGSIGATAGLLYLVAPDEIDEIVVSVPEAAVPLVLEPVHSKIAPRSAYEGKFSLQYTTAALLVHGRVNLATYESPILDDPAVLSLAAKVRYEVQPYPTYPAAFPGGVRIHTRDGRTIESELEYQKGSPQSPLSEDEVRAKFRENAEFALEPDAVGALEDVICSLEVQDDLRAALSPYRSNLRTHDRKEKQLHV
jgi:2-methylcitrate dehydratase PrpD